MSATSNTMAATIRRDRLSRLGILEEPMGYVDGQNLYQFVLSNPVAMLDPLGLAAADGSFKGAGSGGTIAIDGAGVDVGVALKKQGQEEYIWLITQPNKNSPKKYPCQDCEWLQFVHRIVENPDGPIAFKNKNGDIYKNTTDPTKPEYRTDNNNKNSPYASKDYKGAQHNPNTATLLFVDAPVFAVQGKAEKAIYDAFLVCGGKVVYHVHWERHKTAGGASSYENISGQAASTLPDWAKGTLKGNGFDDPTAK